MTSMTTCIISLVCSVSVAASACDGSCTEERPDAVDTNMLLQQRISVDTAVVGLSDTPSSHTHSGGKTWDESENSLSNQNLFAVEPENFEQEVENQLAEAKKAMALQAEAPAAVSATPSAALLERDSCQPPVANRADAGGHNDLYRGWYDVQGCGKCNDYCRWVGGSGTGGDPKEELIHQSSFWSCRLAGTSQTHSPKGHFSNWTVGRCVEEGSTLIGPINALRSSLPTPSTCQAPVKSRADRGHKDIYRGWYDVQGCGKANDYCRWIGGSGSGGDPQLQLIHKKNPTASPSWWSCRLAGTSQIRSPIGFFGAWDLVKGVKKGAAPGPVSALVSDLPQLNTCQPPVSKRKSNGFEDQYRGWYDVQGCGTCNDYCRWIGGSGSGGDPGLKRFHRSSPTKPPSYWSCRLAGTNTVRSPVGYFSSWDLPKCGGEGAEVPQPGVCLSPLANRADAGHGDSYRGWYDVQGCGKCNDYCRWVGSGGSGGDPTQKLNHTNPTDSTKSSWWSCRLAGGGKWDTHTAKGHYSSWRLQKCSGEGADAPHEIPDPTPYVPGQPGGSWSVEEMLIVRAKIHRMFREGHHLQHESGMHAIPWPGATWPSAPKVLRLGFHDCLKYADGSGGCDGCLQWDGVEHRFETKDMGKALFNASDRPDGHNNGLSPTVYVLEAIYTDRAFPQMTPLLPISLQQSGKSRADLWAFAVIEAVRYSMELNNLACDEPDSPSLQGFNQCHPRVNESDCRVTVQNFSFKTGRSDCVSTLNPSYMTSKEEAHPSPMWNGSKVIEFFQRDFNFNGREAVAIMGAHTLGQFHNPIALTRYTWKTRSGKLFNNGYYRNMVKKLDWYYSSYYTSKGADCAESTIGNSSGQRGEARWMPKAWADTSTGGPVQWLQEKLVCPTCEKWAEELDSKPFLRDRYANCCVGYGRGLCKPGCEVWQFVVGIDETMLNSDIGFYYDFNVDANGIPYGCEGFEEFNPAGWDLQVPGGIVNWWNSWTRVNGERAPPRCSLNTLSVPAGSTPLHQIVEEYADDNAAFFRDFVPTLEKMLSNGYSDDDFTAAPTEGMSGYTCPPQDRKDHNRYYECKSDS